MLTFGHLEQTYNDDEILHNIEEVIRKNKSLKHEKQKKGWTPKR